MKLADVVKVMRDRAGSGPDEMNREEWQDAVRRTRCKQNRKAAK